MHGSWVQHRRLYSGVQMMCIHCLSAQLYHPQRILAGISLWIIFLKMLLFSITGVLLISLAISAMPCLPSPFTSPLSLFSTFPILAFLGKQVTHQLLDCNSLASSLFSPFSLFSKIRKSCRVFLAAHWSHIVVCPYKLGSMLCKEEQRNQANCKLLQFFVTI